jgi:SnoaL-like domain
MDWVRDFFRDVDAFQVELLDKWFADDISLRFANNPPINDRQTAIQGLGGFFGTIAGLRHAPESIVGDGDEVTQVAIVTYTRLDKSECPLQVASYLRRNAEGKLDRLWIYIDLAPLFAEAAGQ